MKKGLAVFLAFGMICFCASLALAVVDSTDTGVITLTDPTGPGPNLDVDVSQGVCVAYTAEAGAGGYTGGADVSDDPGQIFSIIAGSAKADQDLSLVFGVRGCQDTDYTDDNQVYQTLAGGPIDVTTVEGQVKTDITGWHIRGGT